ncbi:MAG TPA: IS110 family transposase [Nevskiales bacterium]|nr:IS110 family transposase [Nevskiales bacterium]
MDTTTVAADLAKDVIEVAVAGVSGRSAKRDRLSRKGFSRFLMQQPASLVVMEACGGAHHWARQAQAAGHAVKLLPAQYVKPYRRRNKTDRAGCSALLEASRDPELKPVAVKAPWHQSIQGLHRLRSQWMAARTGRINTLRGLLREFGMTIPVGARMALQQLPEKFEDAAVPAALRPMLHSALAEIRELEQRVDEVERQLKRLTQADPAVQRVQGISGIGLLTSTALVASAVDARNFRSGRHLASWIGLTPREYSSGSTRQLGHISKRGDVYLRMLFIHGARAVLLQAGRLRREGKPLNRLQRWALALRDRAGHNKAACALANKLARIAWATWYYKRDFDPNHAAQAA